VSRAQIPECALASALVELTVRRQLLGAALGFLALEQVRALLAAARDVHSWWALLVVYPTFTIPFCTWKMMGYFKTVPLEIEEAAWVDG